MRAEWNIFKRIWLALQKRFLRGFCLPTCLTTYLSITRLSQNQLGELRERSDLTAAPPLLDSRSVIVAVVLGVGVGTYSASRLNGPRLGQEKLAIQDEAG